MAKDTEYDDETDSEERPEQRRSSAPPRYGPFLTIAVAILMLFGAASRFGKSESGSWLNLDFLASKSLEREQLRLQEQRNLTLVTLGAVPASQAAHAGPEQNIPLAVPLSSRAVLPPSRGEFDLEAYEVEQRQRQDQAAMQLSMPLPLGQSTRPPGDPEGVAGSSKPPSESTRASASGTVYEVRTGDNWVKVGKATGVRWQDIQNANPSSKNGLRVGMKLVIP